MNHNIVLALADPKTDGLELDMLERLATPEELRAAHDFASLQASSIGEEMADVEQEMADLLGADVEKVRAKLRGRR